MARTVKNQEVAQEIKNQEVAQNEKIRFLNPDTNEIELLSDIELQEKAKSIMTSEFNAFASITSWNDACLSGKWNSPYIGKHENGYMTVFHKEARINFKRFIKTKLSTDEIKELAKKHSDEVKTANLFLNNIAVNKGLVSIASVKEMLNAINSESLYIELNCFNSDDEEYTLSVTNQMVRVMLVDRARANNTASNLKSVSIVDLIDILCSGLSMEYHARMKD